MSYFLYQLEFDTPVHFGNAEMGGKLEKYDMEFTADAMFGAVCCELAMQGNGAKLTELYQKTQQGEILFSDLFPYKSVDGSYQFYLPKPVHSIISGDNEAASQQAIRQQVMARKSQKKLKFIRASRMSDYIKSMLNGEDFDETADFGSGELIQRVSCRGKEPLPYYVGQYTFAPDNGMYGILYVKNDSDTEWLEELLNSLGAGGIGGKRSSGCGKFHLADSFLTMDEQGMYADDSALYKMLHDDKARWQMSLSIMLPAEDSLDKVKRGRYKLKKRSGFITHYNEAAVEKKKSIYMLAAGSCFNERIEGKIVSLGMYGGHPVWRYGKGLYMGLM